MGKTLTKHNTRPLPAPTSSATHIDIKLHGPLPRDTQCVADAIYAHLQRPHQYDKPGDADDAHTISISIQADYNVYNFAQSLAHDNTTTINRPIVDDGIESTMTRTAPRAKQQKKSRRPRRNKKETLHIVCCYKQASLNGITTIQPLDQLEAKYTELDNPSALSIHQPLYILLHSTHTDMLDTTLHSFRLWSLTRVVRLGLLTALDHRRPDEDDENQPPIDVIRYVRSLYIANLDATAIRFIMRCSPQKTRIVTCDNSDSYTRFAADMDLLLLPPNLNAIIV